MICSKCGAIVPDNAKFCGNCGQPVTSRVNANTIQMSAKTNESKRLPFIVAGVSGILVIALLVIILIIVLPGKTPMKEVGNALLKTIGVDSMTVDIRLRINDNQERVRLKFVNENDGIIMSIDANDSGDVLKEYFVLNDDGMYEIKMPDFDSSIDADVRRVVDAYSAQNLLSVLNSIKDGEQAFFNESESILNGMIDDRIDCTDLGDYISSVIKDLDSKDNLKDTLRYESSKSGGEVIHSFNPDIYKCLLLVLEKGKDRFVDDALYDDMREKLENIREFCSDRFINISFGIEDDYISSFELEGTYRDSWSDRATTVSYRGHITDINETEIDNKEDILYYYETFK